MRPTNAALLITICLALTACASQQTTPAADPAWRPANEAAPTSRQTTEMTVGERAADVARQLVGVPYRYGGSHPREGFDCSGLVYYSFANAGLRVPRTSSSQYRSVRRVGADQRMPGDLLFFRIEGKVSHVGIYAGDGSFVHAPSSGKTVSMGRLDNPYWSERLVAVGRF